MYVWKKNRYFIFGKTTNKDLSVCLKIGTKNLKPNKILKILGVTLDTKLTFNAYIDNIQKKAKRSLGILR